jgi:hypothetical protein
MMSAGELLDMYKQAACDVGTQARHLSCLCPCTMQTASASKGLPRWSPALGSVAIILERGVRKRFRPERAAAADAKPVEDRPRQRLPDSADCACCRLVADWPPVRRTLPVRTLTLSVRRGSPMPLVTDTWTDHSGPWGSARGMGSCHVASRISCTAVASARLIAAALLASKSSTGRCCVRCIDPRCSAFSDVLCSTGSTQWARPLNARAMARASDTYRGMC